MVKIDRTNCNIKVIWDLIKIKFFVFLIFILPTLSFAQKTDVVILNNGNNITGEIKKMQFSMVSFKTDDMGTLSIKWEKIRHLISKHSFQAEIVTGGMMFGSFDSSSVPGYLIIKGEKESFTVSKNDIVEITPIKSTFWDKFSGSVSLGFNYNKGNGNGQLNFSGEGSFRSKDWSTSSSLNSILSFQDKEQTSKKQDLSISIRRLFPSKWLLGAMFGFEQNTELGISLRTSIIPQGGYMFLQSNSQAFWGLGGLSINNENFIDSTLATFNLDGFAQIQYQIFINNFPKISLTTYLNAYPGLSDWGRLRFNYNINLDWEIINNFYWDLSFYYSFDNREVNNTTSNDYGINTTFKYKFNQ